MSRKLGSPSVDQVKSCPLKTISASVISPVLGPVVVLVTTVTATTPVRLRGPTTSESSFQNIGNRPSVPLITFKVDKGNSLNAIDAVGMSCQDWNDASIAVLTFENSTSLLPAWLIS